MLGKMSRSAESSRHPVSPASACCGAALLPAFLRFLLHQFFCHEDKAQELRPLRYDVSDYLPPFSFGIHLHVEQYPACSREQQKDGQRMITDALEEAVPEVHPRLF